MPEGLEVHVRHRRCHVAHIRRCAVVNVIAQCGDGGADGGAVAALQCLHEGSDVIGERTTAVSSVLVVVIGPGTRCGGTRRTSARAGGPGPAGTSAATTRSRASTGSRGP